MRSADEQVDDMSSLTGWRRRYGRVGDEGAVDSQKRSIIRRRVSEPVLYPRAVEGFYPQAMS